MAHITHSSDVVYALDIGVYNVGVRGQVLASTTAAWCRVDIGTSEFAGLRHSGTPDCGELRIGENTPWRCGRNLIHLAEHIAADLYSGGRVALGFEAPMWLPFERAHRSGRLFTPRFCQENGHEWFLGAGVAAAVKAISLGVMLVSTLLEQYPGLTCTTDCSEWRGKTLMLFEAFVAGSYKIPSPTSLAASASNEWDTFVAALAWGGKHAGLRTPGHVDSVALHHAHCHPGESLSVWKVICDAAGLSDGHTGPSDCEVVALEPRQADTNAS